MNHSSDQSRRGRRHHDRSEEKERKGSEIGEWRRRDRLTYRNADPFENPYKRDCSIGDELKSEEGMNFRDADSFKKPYRDADSFEKPYRRVGSISGELRREEQRDFGDEDWHELESIDGDREVDIRKERSRKKPRENRRFSS